MPQSVSRRTQVCVIGSGAGGGVAAAVLAERGFEVVLVEEGPAVDKSRLTQREDEMYALLYRDAANQRTDDGGVSVLQGRVVGGSTMVNMADVVGVSGPVLAHWRGRYRVDRWSDAAVADAERICREVIGANKIARSQLNRNNARLVEGGEKLGLKVDTMDHNRVGCLGSGYCLVGCAYEAKRSVAVTWIPQALATGRVELLPDTRIDRFERDGDRIVAAVGPGVRIEARSFVLAAGAIHSPLVLAASGLGGSSVGKNLTLQPQAPVAARFPDEVVMFRGIPQAGYVDGEVATEEGGLGGFRIEAVSGGPGMAALSTTLPIAELHRFMTGFRQVSACLCLVSDQPAGTVTADRNGRARIRYALTDDVERRLKDAIRTAARCWLASGAEAVVLPFPEAPVIRKEADLAPLDGYRIRAAATPLLSAHPQGTCRMGPDPASSVVGLDLRVHGAQNLWVTDASVFPTSASSHTQLPVMTFAHLAAEEITA